MLFAQRSRADRVGLVLALFVADPHRRPVDQVARRRYLFLGRVRHVLDHLPPEPVDLRRQVLGLVVLCHVHALLYLGRVSEPDVL